MQKPPPPTIRRATRADVPAIVALLADDVLGRGRESTNPVLDTRYAAAFRAIDTDPNQMLVVMEDAGALVGSLQLTFIPGLAMRGAWRGQIEAVRIASPRRGQALGRVLLNWAIEECRRRGCALVQLTTNKSRKSAVRFYLSVGFKDSHEGMKLELATATAQTNPTASRAAVRSPGRRRVSGSMPKAVI